MRCSLILATIGLITVPAFGSPELLPVRGAHYATCNVATGELTPTIGPERWGDKVWSSSYDTGWYFGSYAYDRVVLDWGDIGGPTRINGFRLGYATDVVLPDRINAIIWYCAEENGFNSAGHVLLAGYRITDLPTGGPTWNGWLVMIDLGGTGYEFTIDGSDLDGDGLVDFGYTYWFQGLPAGSYTGPLISGDPNGFDDAPGQEDAFDAYLLDMNDPNQGRPGTHVNTYWFGGDPFAQFYLQLSSGNYIPLRCWEPGASGKYCTADIWPNNGDGSWEPWFEGDCRVELVELATLLSNYGMTSGAAHEQGDVWPEDGDGVWCDELDGDGRIDLEDLAELLGQYGDDCNLYEEVQQPEAADAAPIIK
jgi:hypothetical protein